jgi:dTDP-4-amino-4,6-dideoxygalactose transaminase
MEITRIFQARPVDIESVMRVFAKSVSAGTYSNFGPVHEDFREELAAFLGVSKGSVALLANATLALQAAIETSERYEEAWTIPSWSFLATGMSALASGATFGFADVAADSGWLRPIDYEGPTLAVAPFSADPRHGFALPGAHVIDAAASIDSCKNIGTSLLPDIGVVISTHATKLLNSGEGGVFVSLDTEWVARVRSWSSFGFIENSRTSVRRGTNAKMSELTAALGLTSLRSWDVDRLQWGEVNRRALAMSEQLNLTSIGGLAEGLTSPYWVVRLESESDRDSLEKSLGAEGVESRRWWGAGMHDLKPFQAIERREDLAQTVKWSRTYLGLPMHTMLTDHDFTKIGSIIHKVLE